jgi:virginiamycin B lyase
MTTFHNRTSAAVLAVAVIVALLMPQVAAAQGTFFSEWAIPGSPYSLAVQSPDTVWVTLPAQNAIARLQRTPQGAGNVQLYPVPTANAEPYDIAFAAGAVWFTERLGNRIGRLDPATGAIIEYIVPTAGSQPTGIAVWPGTPVRVWFAERNGNALGQLAWTNATTFAFTEYPMPWANSQPEAVAVGEESTVWFTAPGSGRVGLFRPATWPNSNAYYGVGAGVGSKPWGLTVTQGESGFPWLTELQTDRVGVYMPQTFSDIRWFRPPSPNSDPWDIAVYGELTGFVERAGNHIALLSSRTGVIREFPLPGAGPTSIDFDVNGCAWVAENAANKIARLCAPNFSMLRLPVTQR